MQRTQHTMASVVEMGPEAAEEEDTEEAARDPGPADDTRTETETAAPSPTRPLPALFRTRP